MKKLDTKIKSELKQDIYFYREHNNNEGRMVPGESNVLKSFKKTFILIAQ